MASGDPGPEYQQSTAWAPPSVDTRETSAAVLLAMVWAVERKSGRHVTSAP